MQALPHLYRAHASATQESNLTTGVENLPSLEVAPPLNFGGPGDKWSPEDLLMAAVADCLILSFRAVARASQLEWLNLECEASGTLDRIERKTRFTHIATRAKLTIPASMDSEKALKLLHKAEATCLISNSLSCACELECEIVIA